ncbi:MAG: glycosyltransferase, partial [Muribaculaceae bacterium]|nr:glycosyltransferase [Muribaculaceae bacterium]
MDKKLTFISRSDIRGGAAIVTYRLVEALRVAGVDARMLVCEKMSDSDFVQVCASAWLIKYSFFKERLKVFFNNGFNRSNLFKVDPACEGLPLWNHPWVRNADAVFLGWVNQGMLSLHGLHKIAGLGKPVIWIMHDMWNMTGICHHAGACDGFHDKCGCCPLLGEGSKQNDMSRKTWESKKLLYEDRKIRFIAVSSWLAQKAAESSLLCDMDVKVIPNPFNIGGDSDLNERSGKRT